MREVPLNEEVPACVFSNMNAVSEIFFNYTVNIISNLIFQMEISTFGTIFDIDHLLIFFNVIFF